ncbi:hypothetical protein W97_03185 [Coniosporium apollinis CBS 100218]|uniref:Uncharacterized protein n=1 Tax=Coniosporium apollinis (strain CBS 100218) TaxID=1168221 RepID=R7YQK1_CONA1|nr:uncharacterized protein W97_03185 [Coniosporium apollinis CBS 100218]EON63956.1 hypothetical protein W97_03185 [Coniosporium apollinis CBS 100218]
MRMVPSYEVTGKACNPSQLAEFRDALADELDSIISSQFKELRSDLLETSILYVNRQIFYEATEILYRDNLFVFQDPLQGVSHFLGRLPDYATTNLRHLAFLSESRIFDMYGTGRHWYEVTDIIERKLQLQSVDITAPITLSMSLAMCSDYPHFQGFKAQWHWSYIRQLATLLANGSIHTLRIVYPPIVVPLLDKQSTEPIPDESVRHMVAKLVSITIMFRKKFKNLHVIRMLMMPRAEGDEEMESRIRASLDKPDEAQALCAKFGTALEARVPHDFVVTREIHKFSAGPAKRGCKPVLVLRRRGGAIGNSKIGLHME